MSVFRRLFERSNPPAAVERPCPDRAKDRRSCSERKHAGRDSVDRDAGAEARRREQVTQFPSLGLGELRGAQELHPVECFAFS